MKTQRRKPRDSVKEQFWRRAIADQAQSNLPTQAYCQRKGLNPRSFRSWRQELARRDGEVTSTRPGQCPASYTDSRTDFTTSQGPFRAATSPPRALIRSAAMRAASVSGSSRMISR